jgi:arsenate reductase
MQITIYHNPRCSKSRQTLALLTDRGLDPVIVEYLLTPPDHQQLDSILRGLGMEPRDLMRKNEDEYKSLGLDDNDLSRGELIDAMIASPRLIQRPIVVAGDKIVVGRPPEAVLEIL